MDQVIMRAIVNRDARKFHWPLQTIYRLRLCCGLVCTAENSDDDNAVLNKQLNQYFCFSFDSQAYTVLGQYLILKKDSELFKDWMKDTCNANSKQAADCYQCLNDWCEEFL